MVRRRGEVRVGDGDDEAVRERRRDDLVLERFPEPLQRGAAPLRHDSVGAVEREHDQTTIGRYRNAYTTIVWKRR